MKVYSTIMTFILVILRECDTMTGGTAGDCACLYCLPARRLHYIKEVEIRTDELKTILSASKSQRANISKNHGSRNQVYQSILYFGYVLLFQFILLFFSDWKFLFFFLSSSLMDSLLIPKVGKHSQLSIHQQAKLSVKSVKVIRCVHFPYEYDWYRAFL